MIEARSLTKRFGHELVLDQIDVKIQAGEFVSIVGPSGCGKSTMLRIIASLDRPTDGELILSDSPSNERAADVRTDRIAFVFQEPNLLPWRSVRRNIALPDEFHRRMTNDERTARVSECLRLVGLSEEDARKLPRSLSGGMKMRASIARALMLRPQLLLLDEPFAALDELIRQQINEDLLRLWMTQKWTSVFVTHHVSEAVFLSQRVLVMSARPGRLLKEISIDEPYPRNDDFRLSTSFQSLVSQVSQALRQGTSQGGAA